MLNEPDRRARLFAAVSWALPFALVVFLALRGGGYEPIDRDQVLVIVWAAIIVAALVGFIPAVRITRAAWVALGLLAVFVGWTALSSTWSESAERSMDTVPLLGGYLAVFALSVMTSGRDAVIRMVSAVGAAIAVIAGLALLSRYVPGWFPEDEAAARIPEVAARLKYPLGSWNGLSGMIAMGIPLLLAVVFEAKTTVARALAAAAIPVTALAIGYTISRGGLIAAILAVAVFVALRPRRMAMAPMLAMLAVGCAIALLAAAQFDELKNLTGDYESQQVPMLLITIAIGAAVAIATVAMIAAERRGPLPVLEVSPAATRRLLAGAAAVGAIVVVGAIASGEAADAWERFKDPAAPDATAGRLASGSGNQRYQQWDAALAAVAEDPIGGKGAGTYEFWWARTAPVPGYSRYAHSLYFETLAETGYVGMVLIVALVALILVILARRAWLAPPDRRGWLAGAAGCGVAFALTMGIDWAWVIPVVPVAFFLVAGAAIQFGAGPWSWARRASLAARAVIVAVALSLLAVTGRGLYADQRIVDSQQAFQAGDLDAALDAAGDAESAESFAATPHLQQALVLEQQGDLETALSEILIAIQKDFFDWEPRYVLSRIVELRGDPQEAKLYFERARQLNPWSPIFLNDADESALTPNE